MVATTGQPERSRWGTEDWDHPTLNPWAVEAVRARGYDDYGLGILPTDPNAEPLVQVAQLEPRAQRTSEQALAAVRDAIGDADWTQPEQDPKEQQESLEQALRLQERMEVSRRNADAPEALPEAHSESRAYVVREGNWRERHDLPRRRKTVPPSRTREGRRAERIRAKARHLGLDGYTVERTTQRRQSRPAPRTAPGG